ncbi:hypothetical protein Q5P01_014991 [Channa striata]|uniref:Uncharacterized protein n=1 Tax=Channa striata TaxID=64152 RepID=A0AA88MHE3_CHASR|nr:hypothetical protein Q5P01_014991 [Channa striata]
MPKGGVCLMQPEGRDQRWVCVSQLMRVSTDRLHHQHPTLTAVEGSIPGITEPRCRRRIARARPSTTDAAALRQHGPVRLPYSEPPSCKICVCPHYLH